MSDEKQENSAEASEAKKVCLVVDDDRVCNGVYVQMAEDMGLETHPFYDGEEAIKHCKEKMPDIIFLDLNMPKVHGGDVLASLYSLGSEKKPFVVICSGADYANEMFETDSAKKMLEDVGADAFLVKPCKPEDFKEVLKGKV